MSARKGRKSGTEKKKTKRSHKRSLRYGFITVKW